ncbi:hypothetical protein HDV00_003553 [Rhizophlyctis rosea]|nr:hypothetical protein HDV00_003553 [Rhizophlyctis rosea]
MQAQHRYIIMSSIIERLNDEKLDMSPAAKNSLIQSLKHLITYGGGSVGLTVLELLETLVSHLHRSAKRTAASIEESKNAEEMAIQTSLIESIGSLSIHLAYPDQINDIVAFVTNRLRLDAANDSNAPVLDDVTKEVRRLHLRALGAVASTRETQLQNGALQRRNSMLRSPVSYELLAPMLQFLSDDDPELRINFYMFFHSLMMLESLEAAVAPTPSSTLKFCAVLHRRLFEWATAPNTNPADFVIIGNIFIAALRRYLIDELVRTVPIMLKLQALAIGEAIPTQSRQRAVGNIVVEYFAAAGEYLGNDDLVKYAVQIKTERIEKREWSPEVELKPHVVGELGTRTFSDTEGADFTSLKPVRVPLDENRIVEILTRDAMLSDTSGIRDTLLIEYVPGETEHEGEFTLPRKARRTSVTHKPSASLTASVFRKVAPSISASSTSDIAPPTIKVDELKEALSNASGSTPGSIRIADTSELEAHSISAQHQLRPDVKGLLNSISQNLEPYVIVLKFERMDSSDVYLCRQRRQPNASEPSKRVKSQPSSEPMNSTPVINASTVINVIPASPNTPKKPLEYQPKLNGRPSLERTSMDSTRPSLDSLRSRVGAVGAGAMRRGSQSDAPTHGGPAELLGSTLKHATSTGSFRPKEPSLRNFTA